MKEITAKVSTLLTALADVYRDEENRDLESFPKLEPSEDFGEDITAILIAAKILAEQMIGSDWDIIEFIHILNKLAVQYVLQSHGIALSEEV